MFGNQLKDAVQKTPGGHSAVLMGLDGIPVDFFSSDGQLDIETIGMEFSVILKEVCKTVFFVQPTGPMRLRRTRWNRFNLPATALPECPCYSQARGRKW